MHDNPRATEDEQELAQTDRMDEEEAMRGAQAPAEETDGEDSDAEDD